MNTFSNTANKKVFSIESSENLSIIFHTVLWQMYRCYTDHHNKECPHGYCVFWGTVTNAYVLPGVFLLYILYEYEVWENH